MTAKEIKLAMLCNKQIGMLSELLLHSWPSIKAEVQKDLQQYWSFRDEIAIIHHTAMKGRRIIIYVILQSKALKELHLKHVGILKTRLLACESIYLVYMNADVKQIVKNCLTS